MSPQIPVFSDAKQILVLWMKIKANYNEMHLYECFHNTWWCHQMETFSALLALCAGNSPVTGELIAQRPVTRSSHVFFDLRLFKRLNKQSRGWWFETQSRSLWRHFNEYLVSITKVTTIIKINYMMSLSWKSKDMVTEIKILSIKLYIDSVTSTITDWTNRTSHKTSTPFW